MGNSDYSNRPSTLNSQSKPWRVNNFRNIHVGKKGKRYSSNSASHNNKKYDHNSNINNKINKVQVGKSKITQINNSSSASIQCHSQICNLQAQRKLSLYKRNQQKQKINKSSINREPERIYNQKQRSQIKLEKAKRQIGSDKNKTAKREQYLQNSDNSYPQKNEHMKQKIKDIREKRKQFSTDISKSLVKRAYILKQNQTKLFQKKNIDFVNQSFGNFGKTDQIWKITKKGNDNFENMFATVEGVFQTGAINQCKQIDQVRGCDDKQMFGNNLGNQNLRKAQHNKKKQQYLKIPRYSDKQNWKGDNSSMRAKNSSKVESTY